MTNEAKKEYTFRISQANRTELIVILYEMFLNYMEEARLSNGKGNRGEFRENIKRGRGCINELMNSLDFGYEPADSLLQLYIYVNKELACADVRNTKEPLDHCCKVIHGLLEAYREVSRQDTSGPVMENAQAVYAGLTYGKGELKESLADQGANRGFLA